MSPPILPPKELDLRSYFAGCALTNSILARGVTSDQELAARCIYIADLMIKMLHSDELPDVQQPTEEEMLRWAFGTAWQTKSAEQSDKQPRARSTIIPPTQKKRPADSDRLSTVPAPSRTRYHEVNLAEEIISPIKKG